MLSLTHQLHNSGMLHSKVQFTTIQSIQSGISYLHYVEFINNPQLQHHVGDTPAHLLQTHDWGAGILKIDGAVLRKVWAQNTAVLDDTNPGFIDPNDPHNWVIWERR